MSSQYNKAIIFALTIVIAVGNQILTATGLGISPQISQWISLAVLIAGAVLATLTSNKNTPQLQPGQVVVPATAVKPEATAQIVAVHKA